MKSWTYSAPPRHSPSSTGCLRTCGGEGEQQLQRVRWIGEANDSPPLLAAVQAGSAVPGMRVASTGGSRPTPNLAHLVGQAAVAVDVAEKPADGSRQLQAREAHAEGLCRPMKTDDGLQTILAACWHLQAWPAVAIATAPASPNAAASPTRPQQAASHLSTLSQHSVYLPQHRCLVRGQVDLGIVTDEQGGRSQLWASISKYTAQPPRKWSIVATGRRRVR